MGAVLDLDDPGTVTLEEYRRTRGHPPTRDSEAVGAVSSASGPSSAKGGDLVPQHRRRLPPSRTGPCGGVTGAVSQRRRRPSRVSTDDSSGGADHGLAVLSYDSPDGS
jgi:hypothetical protein